MRCNWKSVGGLLGRIFNQMGPGSQMTKWSCYSIPVMPTFLILLHGGKNKKLIYLVTVGLSGESRCDAFPTDTYIDQS